MTYATEKAKAARKPLRITEIDFKKCAYEYGKSVTNLLTYSEQIDNAAYTKTRSSITSNAAISPDGTLTADKLVEDATASNTHFFFQSKTITSGATVTASLYVKAAERTQIQILSWDGVSSLANAIFDLDAGSIVSISVGSAEIERLGNGWFRISVTGTSSTTSASLHCYLFSGGNNTYSGDGASGAYVWGAQLVEGSKPGHYVKTTTTSTTAGCGATDAKANLLTYSEQLDNAAWTKNNSSISADAAAAPDGNLTADKLVEDTSASIYHRVFQSITGTDNTVYTGSVYLKAAERSQANLLLWDPTNSLVIESILFDLSDGSKLSGSGIFKIEDAGNGWYRVSITGTSSTGIGNIDFYVQMMTGGAINYTGDGSSGLYIWGAQLVEAAIPGIYYKTEATAFSGTVGTECYNTRKTCQDVSSYTNGPRQTIRLCEQTAEGMQDISAIPCVTKVDTAHTEIAPGQESTGKSAGMAIRCTDFPHHDRGVDPYVDGRTYTPEEQGTYFGKLKARNPYYQDGVVRVMSGYLSDAYDAANFKTRTYFLEKFEGPDKSGQVKFVAQDIMRRLDDKRATCPEITVGKLTAALAAATTSSFTVDGDADKYDTGGGAVRINDEVIEYASGTNNGDGTFTFSTLTRGASNTTADDHSADDGVQKCVDFTDAYPRDIAYTLYNTYAGIPDSYLDTTQWDTIADTWLQKTYSRRLTDPVGVKQLLAECHIQMAFFTWWDEEASKIKLEAIRPPDYNSISTYTQGSHLKRDSVEVEEKTDKRITQVHVYYLPKNPIEGDKPEHFRRRVRNIDAGAESDDQYGDSHIKEIFANWIQSDGSAINVSNRQVNRFRDNVRLIKFEMDAKDESLKTGDQAYINSDALQDFDGQAGDTLIQVIQRDEIESGSVYAYRAWELFYSGRYAFIMASGSPDYGSATDAQKRSGCWISGAGGADFADGGEAYKII